MNICIPVTEDRGLDSPICAHFGSTPMFMLIDTETGECTPLQNQNLHHQHGMCQPLLALAGHDVDGLIVGGIGGGALNKLTAAGIEVYLADSPTVGAVVESLKQGKLRKYDSTMSCAGHGHNGH